MLEFQKFLPFEQNIGYKFRNLKLLVEALSHPSLKATNPAIKENYEKLELLGDAVLNLIITENLIKLFPNELEGALAKLKSYLVSKIVLHKIALSLELPKVLLMSPGEEKIGGRSNINNIENAMEALIAAIYLDSDLKVISSLINDWWQPYYFDKEAAIDPKSVLQEWTQQRNIPLPNYQITAIDSQDHCPTFRVAVEIQGIEPQYGEGRTRKEAEKEAARRLLKLLK